MDNHLYSETDELFEIWDGEKTMMSPASPKHELALGNTYAVLRGFVRKHRLGRLYLSNTPVFLKGDTSEFRMPDLSFVAKANTSIVKETGLHGAPDLIVEIISPGIQNTLRDTEQKFHIYERYGVREYWIVDPYEHTISIYVLQEGTYRQAEQSVVLSGLTVSPDDIFEETDLE